MLRRLVGFGFGLVALAAVGYVVFFVPVGRRTLYEHLEGIAATEPARALGHDLKQASKRLGNTVAAKLRDVASPDAGPH